MYNTDQRTVVTLDAGGTNFVFGAMRGCEFVVEPLTLPSRAHDLDLCLATMVEGFRSIIDRLDRKPDAISFAFPARPTMQTASLGDFCQISPRSARGWPSGRS